VPGWRLRSSLAASIPSRWNDGGMRMSGDEHLRRGRLGARDQPVVIGGHADDVEVALESEQGAHPFAHDEVVIGEEHRDLPVSHVSFLLHQSAGGRVSARRGWVRPPAPPGEGWHAGACGSRS
jgi:hypothetical protein